MVLATFNDESTPKSVILATKTPSYSRSLLNMLRISQGKPSEIRKRNDEVIISLGEPPYGAGKNTKIHKN